MLAILCRKALRIGMLCEQGRAAVVTPGQHEGKGEGARLGSSPFADRADAGRTLARHLLGYRGKHALILALPRGGVPVAAEVAAALDAELEVIVARKLGAPNQPELAIGAVTSDGTRFLNAEILRSVEASPAYVEITAREEQAEAQRREQCFRAGLPPLEMSGRTVIVIDDGLATGATMRAAVGAVQRAQPKRLVVAVPVGAIETCAWLEREVDELVCPLRPESFFSVGTYYGDFDQTRDEQVIELLRKHATRNSPHAARS